MTNNDDQKTLKAMKLYGEMLAKDKDSAQSFLLDAGIIDKSGKTKVLVSDPDEELVEETIDDSGLSFMQAVEEMKKGNWIKRKDHLDRFWMYLEKGSNNICFEGVDTSLSPSVKAYFEIDDFYAKDWIVRGVLTAYEK